MMIKLIGFEPSNYKNKKYNAILKIKNPETGLEVTQKVPFGDRRFQHYYDKIVLFIKVLVVLYKCISYFKLSHWELSLRFGSRFFEFFRLSFHICFRLLISFFKKLKILVSRGTKRNEPLYNFYSKHCNFVDFDNCVKSSNENKKFNWKYI